MLSYKQVQRLSKEIASTKQSLKRLCRAVSNLFLRAQQITVVLAVYMLSEYDIGAARAYVRFAHGQKRANAYAHTEYTDATLDARIENWYLEAALDKLVKLQDPGPAHREAVRFLAQNQTVFWVSRQNERGVAPTSAATASVFAQTCQKFGVLEQALVRSLHNNTISHGHGRHMRKWAKRYRERFHLRFGVLKSGPVPGPVEETRRKAVRRHFGPFLRSLNWYQKKRPKWERQWERRYGKLENPSSQRFPF